MVSPGSVESMAKAWSQIELEPACINTLIPVHSHSNPCEVIPELMDKIPAPETAVPPLPGCLGQKSWRVRQIVLKFWNPVIPNA